MSSFLGLSPMRRNHPGLLSLSAGVGGFGRYSVA